MYAKGFHPIPRNRAKALEYYIIALQYAVDDMTDCVYDIYDGMSLLYMYIYVCVSVYASTPYAIL